MRVADMGCRRVLQLQLLPFFSFIAKGDDQTDVIERLNGMIARSEGGDGVSNGVYTNGRGVLVRNPMDGMPSRIVLPATFWVNDIFAPSQLYPQNALVGNIDCPNDGNNGFFDLVEGSCNEGPWDFASMAFVIGSSMDQIFPDFDHIQDGDWGWGVFYPSDSNAADYRCEYQWVNNGWDCPGGWVDSTGGWLEDLSKGGAGYYNFGNPHVDDLTGGGAGCHRDKGDYYGGNFIDQTDAYDGDGLNIIGDYYCQCNYVFQDSWEHWVQHWIAHAAPKPGANAYGWFGGGTAPNRALDQAACWVNNPRDMIMLQNQLWWQRDSWNNGRAPQNSWSNDPASLRIYWGWNEVPIPSGQAMDPNLWDAVVIKLPAAACGNNGGDDSLWCLGDRQMQALEQDIDGWVDANYIEVGWDYHASRPGSYVVIVREWMDEDFNWQRYFFCESWTSPSNKYQIIYRDRSISQLDYKGACYLEWAGVGALGSTGNETSISV